MKIEKLSIRIGDESDEKINNYRKKKNNEITYSNIDEYHKTTNEDREAFYVDWRKE